MANPRGMQPRSTAQYSNESHGRRGNFQPPDDRTIDPAAGRVNLIRPRGKEGPLIFRPWPPLMAADPTSFEAGRSGPRSGQYTDWFVRAPAIRYAGLKNPSCVPVTYIPYYPWETDKGKSHPYAVLYSAATAAFKATTFNNGKRWQVEWNRILSGDATGGAELSKPAAVYFMQGHVYVNGTKNYCAGDRKSPLGLDAKDELIVLQCSVSCGEQLVALLDKRKAEGEDSPSNPSAAFVFGDPVGTYNQETAGVDGGLIVTIFNPKQQPKEYKYSSWDGEIKSWQGYEAAISKKYVAENRKIYTSAMTAAEAQRVRDMWQFWWPDAPTSQPGLLRVPSYDEQALMIAKAFCTAPLLLEFAWADNPEFMTADVRDILASKRQSVVPGGDEDDAPAVPERRAPRTDAATANAARSKAASAPVDESDFDDASLDAEPPVATGKPKRKAAAEFEDAADDSVGEPEPAADADADMFAEDPKPVRKGAASALDTETVFTETDAATDDPDALTDEMAAEDDAELEEEPVAAKAKPKVKPKAPAFEEDEAEPDEDEPAEDDEAEPEPAPAATTGRQPRSSGTAASPARMAPTPVAKPAANAAAGTPAMKAAMEAAKARAAGRTSQSVPASRPSSTTKPTTGASRGPAKK